MKEELNIFWFRRDLRLHDNAGLFACLSAGKPVLPLFIFDSNILSELPDKDDRRVNFIYQAVRSMHDQLTSVGSSLRVMIGEPLHVFQELLQQYKIATVFTNEDYEPYAISRDEAIKNFLKANGSQFSIHKDQVIFAKNEVEKTSQEPYLVFTPYAKKWLAQLENSVLQPFNSEGLMDRYHKCTAFSLPSLQQIGFSKSARIPKGANVDEQIIRHYDETRNFPAQNGTTKMGVHLRFGTISIRKLVATAKELNEVYLKELVWREFFMQLLWRFPKLVNECFKKNYEGIEWRNNEAEFERWCQGETGFALVDAGMRELNETGFMHNRVRMVAASFLIKDLLVDWRWGEAYFARKLLDFELSSNNGNWQWAAGCGCDAAPYFRVFNPDLQAKKFDPNLEYISKWVPEYNTLSYTPRMVDHAMAKERCIKVYKAALLRN